MDNRRNSFWGFLGGTAIIAAVAAGMYALVKKVYDVQAQTPIDEDEAPEAQDKIIWIKQPDEEAAEAEIQATLDLDGDGEADAVALDTTGDGQADTILADTTGDGLADTALVDLDGDGTFDVAIEIENDPE